MNNLLDGRHPRDVGREHGFDYGRYTEAVDAIQGSTESVMLAESGDEETGVLLIVDDRLRQKLKLPAEIDALVHWSDGNESEPDEEVRLLDSNETRLLLAESESVIIELICRHYEKQPEDDGHPAHALYHLWNERRKNAAEAARERSGRADAEEGGR